MLLLLLFVLSQSIVSVYTKKRRGYDLEGYFPKHHVNCTRIGENNHLECSCDNGYGWGDMGCTDINECETGTSNCSDTSICTNRDGSYHCSCAPRLYQHEMGMRTSCHECWQGSYGEGCRQKCSVNCKDKLCHPDSGSCLRGCMPGFMGGRCDVDLQALKDIPQDKDGCDKGKAKCPDNSTCVNNNGSYVCACGPGFSLVKKGKTQLCQECKERRYGVGCQNTCSDKCKDGTCDNVNGTCLGSCTPGYRGDQCQLKCGSGKYGEGCAHPCRVQCLNTLCDHITGHCTEGCVTGFSGRLCDKVLPMTTTPTTTTTTTTTTTSTMSKTAPGAIVTTPKSTTLTTLLTTTSYVPTVTPSHKQALSTTTIWILCGVGGGILLMVICVVICVCCTPQKRKLKVDKKKEENQPNKIVTGTDYFRKLRAGDARSQHGVGDELPSAPHSDGPSYEDSSSCVVTEVPYATVGKPSPIVTPMRRSKAHVNVNMSGESPRLTVHLGSRDLYSAPVPLGVHEPNETYAYDTTATF